ncbi:hypothetical protein [uncultured Lutibacter sp.]|uniref:toxin-antitoxin system YwqK family antitoxin n=1 Tax=uncultured Lutibacter sp. TaxID=437739 RepID=UPI002611A42A|nr:hypothetical protein [uncultured Lutibacter sp.]
MNPMKNTYKLIIFIIGLLIISSYSIAQTAEQNSAEDKKSAKTFVKAETMKAVGNNLAIALDAERNSGAVTKAMTKFWEAAKGLNKNQVQKLASRWAKASTTSIKQLINLSPSQLSSYARDVTSNIKFDSKTLKNIIYGAGDKAGNATLKILTEMDNVIAETGTVSAELLKKMRSEAAGLDPKQASAFYDLLKNKLSKDWKKLSNTKNLTEGLGKYVGTAVDGYFVLSDAYDIYYSDDEAEVKAIKATGKIIDYGASTGAGVASAALGGGLGPGLVIAFSANRVSTLYTEIAMLQKEREEAKDALKNERIDNAILVRRQLVNINNKIKSGEIRNANSLIYKLKTFLLDHSSENEGKLFDLLKDLEEKSEIAERNLLINGIVNEARHPYRKAITNYTKGVQLHLAKIYAAEALAILNKNLQTYPEIGGLTAISKTQQLINAINEKIANAAEFSITRVAAPERVYVGQSIDIPVFVTGGIPYYSSVGEIGSNISEDAEVTMFWYASVVPGIEKFTITLKDCMGSIASTSVSIEVVEEIEEIEEENEEPVNEKYSGLKEFVDVSKLSNKTHEHHYFASKFHSGYSKEYRDKVWSGKRENNEGPWRTGNSGTGQETIWYCLPHGPYKHYCFDGEKILYSEGNYNNGRRHGKWTYYHISPGTQGEIEKIQNYKNDVLHGTQTTYVFYKSKEDFRKIENFKDGKKDGTQITYNSDIPGGIEHERIYQNGKFISGYYYAFSGREKGADGKYKEIYEKMIYEE